MVVGHKAKQVLHQGEVHEIPEQHHYNTRGHMVLVDITEHTDPNVTLSVDFEVSTDDGATWQYGGGMTIAGGGHTIDKNGDSVTYINAVFGHEPTPLHCDHNGCMVGSDPASHRRVRGIIHVLTTRPPFIAGITVPGAPSVKVFGTDWKPTMARDYLHVGGKPHKVNTRVHVIGTRGVSLDKSLIPTD